MKIKRILLLDPPFYRFIGEDQRSVPLGVAYLAASLVAQGFYDTVIYNADFDPKQSLSVSNRSYYDEMTLFDAYLTAVTNDSHLIYQEVISTIVDYKPDLIGISLRTAKFYSAKTIIRLCREVLGNIPIAVGGPHATANPDHALTRTDADFVIRGEGEQTVVELVKALNQGTGLENVDGVSYRRQDGIVVHNPPRSLISDLDHLPFPARDLILHSQMMAPNDFSNIFSSRGCPFACTFCDSRHTWTRKVRRHSPQHVVNEILAIKDKYGASFFSFQDDCFVTNKEHTIALCDEIRRSGLADLAKTEFRWWYEIHPNVVTEEIIRKTKEANCVAVAIGAESGFQRTLESINKASSLATIRRAAKIIRDAGLHLTVFFMIGFPWETQSDIQETLNFMEELEPDGPTLSVLTPLPGSPIYKYCVERNLVQYDKDYLTLFHQRDSHFYSDLISDKQSRVIIKDALSRAENIANRRRREKISQFIRNRVSPDILSKEDTLLNVTEVDQSYKDEKIVIQLDEQAGKQFLSESSIRRIGTMILNEFPEYASVIFQKNTDGVQIRMWTQLANSITPSLVR